MSGARHSRGDISIETVLYFPVVLFVFLSAFHFAALLHASHIAGLASSRGAYVAATGLATHGHAIRITDDVSRVVQELGAQMGTAPSLQVGPRSVTVTVTVMSPQIVPFLPVSARRSSSHSLEGFIEESSR